MLASACCLGPLALGALGLGSLGVGAVLAPLRPWLLVVTAVLLGVAFYFAYRPRREPSCGPDGDCARLPSRSAQRLALWIVTALTVTLATYPSWGARLFPRSPSVLAASANGLVVLDIAGMTCTACEGEIERELLRVPGVLGARVDYPSGRAEIQLAATRADVDPLVAAVKRAGYDASPALQSVADDPTRLEPLSSNAAELRKRFNDDREYTRLVMLLSPS